MTSIVVMYCIARGTVAQAGEGAKSLPTSAEEEMIKPVPLNNMAWQKARIKTLRFILLVRGGIVVNILHCVEIF